jgi:hypothetical protein
MTVLKRSARLWLPAVFLLGLAPPATAASPPEKLSPLIQLQGSRFLCTESRPDVGGAVCVKGAFQERSFSVFQRSRAISIVTDGGYDLAQEPDTQPALSTVRDGFLLWRDIEALNAYLASIGIQNRRGGCNPFGASPEFQVEGSGAEYTIFWYGRDGRRTTIPFGTRFTTACPPQILDLFNRLTRLEKAIRMP